MTTEKQITQYIRKKVPVTIRRNDETGVWWYSVEVLGTDFWLNSFVKKKDALAYIKKYKLPYIVK